MVDCGGECVGNGLGGCVDRVAVCLEVPAAIGCDGSVGQMAVAPDRGKHGVAGRFPASGAAFDVGKKERDGPGRRADMAILMCRRQTMPRLGLSGVGVVG